MNLSTAQLGARSAFAVVAVGIAYALVLTAGMAEHGLSEPIGDPILTFMEVLTILSALPILTLCVALRAAAAPQLRSWATLSLAFAAMFCCVTGGVHIVELTVGRAMARSGLVWPSVSYAVELFAWDFLLGTALVLMAHALVNTARARRIRIWLRITGSFCLAGLLGPLFGNMRVQLIGVVGYALLLPVTAWLLAAWFRNAAREHSRDAA